MSAFLPMVTWLMTPLGKALFYGYDPDTKKVCVCHKAKDMPADAQPKHGKMQVLWHKLEDVTKI